MKVFAIILAAATVVSVAAEGTRAGTTTTEYDHESPENFFRKLQSTDGGAGSCNLYCEDDSDCKLDSGDWNPCNVCGTRSGTQFQNRCYSALEDSAGQCNLKCKKDKDCQTDGWNACSSCGEYVGAQFYEHCYNPDANPQKPANDCDEGQCCNHCNKNSDCQKGGFNPCGKCGQKAGTQYYRRCYDPDYVG
mmetsp:Transcript_34321/g.75514  ORF Transcript_34321/g.75514 Transcript_34321/m.75514 type:complete len:191 (-) Transcript_34321:192-764(-)